MVPKAHQHIADQEWAEFLVLASTPLRQLTPSLLPSRIASAVIIEYQSERVLLTDHHIMKPGGDWAVELRYDPQNQRTINYVLDGLNFVTRATKAGSKWIDFAYQRIPADVWPTYQELRERPGGAEILREVPRFILPTDLAAVPQVGREYGFAGTVRPRIGDNWLEAHVEIEPHMTFVEESGGAYVFKLTHAHLGHKYYRGCSGAPICDSDGTLVALVLGGSRKDREIYGLPLIHYRKFVDALLERAG